MPSFLSFLGLAPTHPPTHLVAPEAEREGDVVGHAQELPERHAVLAAADAQLLHQGDRVLDAGLVVRGHHHLGAVAPSHVLEHQGHGRVVAGVSLLDRLFVLVEEWGCTEETGGRSDESFVKFLLTRGAGACPSVACLP